MSLLLILWRCSFLIIISISEESKPIVNIWSGTKTKCQFYVERLSIFHMKIRKLWLATETLKYSHQTQVFICLEWNYWKMLFREIELESNSFSIFANNDNFNIAQYVLFVTFCILLPNILLANPVRVWGQLMLVKCLKLENWKLC